jgi:hypothetical protein
VIRNDSPDDVVIDLVVLMREDVTRRDHRSPGKVLVSFAKTDRQPAGRFADHFDVSLDSMSQDFFLLVVFACLPAVCRRIASAARIMSYNAAASDLSRGIQNLSRVQDFVPPKWVLQELLLDQVDFPSPEHRGKLVAHLKQPLDRHRVARIKCDEHIDVAVGREIISQS